MNEIEQLVQAGEDRGLVIGWVCGLVMGSVLTLVASWLLGGCQ